MTKIFSLEIKEGKFVKEIEYCEQCPLCTSDEFGSRCALLIFDYGVYEEHLINEIVHEMCHLPDKYVPTKEDLEEMKRIDDMLEVLKMEFVMKDPFTPESLGPQEHAPTRNCWHPTY